MQLIKDQQFGGERPLFATHDLRLENITIIDGESGKSIAGGKGTTAVGRKSSAATKPSMQPRTKQSYDLKGRRVGKGKKAKGAYYRK